MWGHQSGGLCGVIWGSPTLTPPPCTSPALLFDGSTNPAHPKHIGSIDPHCSVANVVRGLWGRGGVGSHPAGGGTASGRGFGGGVQSLKVPLISFLWEPPVSRAGQASAKGCLGVLGSPRRFVGSLKLQNILGCGEKGGGPKALVPSVPTLPPRSPPPQTPTTWPSCCATSTTWPRPTWRSRR